MSYWREGIGMQGGVEGVRGCGVLGTDWPEGELFMRKLKCNLYILDYKR